MHFGKLFVILSLRVKKRRGPLSHIRKHGKGKDLCQQLDMARKIVDTWKLPGTCVCALAIHYEFTL